jgi:hypothetical protein
MSAGDKEQAKVEEEVPIFALLEYPDSFRVGEVVVDRAVAAAVASRVPQLVASAPRRWIGEVVTVRKRSAQLFWWQLCG